MSAEHCPWPPGHRLPGCMGMYGYEAESCVGVREYVSHQAQRRGEMCYDENIIGDRVHDNEMKRELMDILCCPKCKGDLELSVFERSDDEIISGDLYCRNCDIHFPIEDGIPNMLLPEMRE